MRNLFIEFRELLAPGVLMVGVVTATDAAGVTVQLPGGGIVRARGQASVGDHVFVRDGMVDGPAPDLPDVSGEV